MPVFSTVVVSAFREEHKFKVFEHKNAQENIWVKKG
jgi:hypothetical protein